MLGEPIAHIGATSSHGGVIITGKSPFTVSGIPIATLGDSHSCPIPGHGVTPIVTASQISTIWDIGIARVTSTVGCGAVIVHAIPLFTTE